jgi:hypothetical protein
MKGKDISGQHAFTTHEHTVGRTLAEVEYETRATVLFPLDVTNVQSIGIDLTKGKKLWSIAHIEGKALVPEVWDKVSLNRAAKRSGPAHRVILNLSADLKQLSSAELGNLPGQTRSSEVSANRRGEDGDARGNHCSRCACRRKLA